MKTDRVYALEKALVVTTIRLQQVKIRALSAFYFGIVGAMMTGISIGILLKPHVSGLFKGLFFFGGLAIVVSSIWEALALLRVKSAEPEDI